MLGAQGWSDDYDKPLGDPLGPAKFVGGAQATLTRTFRTGTKVVFTYDQDGKVRRDCLRQLPRYDKRLQLHHY